VQKDSSQALEQNDWREFKPLFGGGKIKICDTLRAVTPFGGLSVLIEFLGRIGLVERLSHRPPYQPKSPNHYDPGQILVGFMLSVIAGAQRFAHANQLRADRALHALLGMRRFPSDDTLLNYFRRFSQADVERFWRPLWRWLISRLPLLEKGFSLHLDSTIFSRHGTQQQGAARGYHPRRPGRLSHHPLLAVLAEANFVLHAWLLSGNTGSGQGAAQFLSEALSLLGSAHRIRCVRADSGFYADNFLSFLEERQLPYIIVARLTTYLKSRLYQIHQWQAVDATYSVSEFNFKLWSWKSARRFVVVREEVQSRSRRWAAGSLSCQVTFSGSLLPIRAIQPWKSGAITMAAPPLSAALTSSRTNWLLIISACARSSRPSRLSWLCSSVSICWVNFSAPLTRHSRATNSLLPSASSSLPVVPSWAVADTIWSYTCPKTGAATRTASPYSKSSYTGLPQFLRSSIHKRKMPHDFPQI
jgi:hypothetical protein